MTKPWRNITTIWSDKKNCVFVFISVNLTGDSTTSVADVTTLPEALNTATHDVAQVAENIGRLIEKTLAK